MTTCACGAAIGAKSKKCKSCHTKAMRLAQAQKKAERLVAVGAVPPISSSVFAPVVASAEPVVRVGPSYTEGLEDGLDPTVVVGKDPKFAYRFVTGDPQHVARAKAKGYQPVKEGDPEAAPFLDHGRPDKIVGYAGGEGIMLMRAPKDKVEGRRKALRDRMEGVGKREHEATIARQLADGTLGKKQAEKLLKEGFALRNTSMAELEGE